jgi:ABC-type sugar transport system substrate-binding protein
MNTDNVLSGDVTADENGANKVKISKSSTFRFGMQGPRLRSRSKLQLATVAAVVTATLGMGFGSSAIANAAGARATSAKLSSVQMAALVTAAETGTGVSSSICEGRKWTFGIDIYPTTITFGADVVAGAKAIAKSTGCVKTIILSDNLVAETVIANMNSFVQQKVNGIALLNAVQGPEIEAISIAKAAKIPIVTASLAEPGTPFIDVNDMQAGLQEGSAVAVAFKSKIGNKKPYIIIANYPLLPPASDRVTGWLKAVEQVFPGIPKSHIRSFNSQLNVAVTAQAMGPILATLPSGVPIMTVGINDDVSFQAAKMARAAGHPVAGSGFGGDHNGRAHVCTGFFNTDGWNPELTMAYQYPALIAMAFGHHFPNQVPQKTEVLTLQTINQYYPGTCKK